MVPKVAGKGRSFKGAGLYYLHDKKASTRGRVAFTHTENLPTRDPDRAIKFMAYTAMRQDALKARAGGSTKGRKLTQPVYCYSLSWAPSEDPSQEEMIEAAKTTLKALGLEGHEALFVGHNDEPHPHIHVIVNRVHPETGIAAKLANDHLKLSTWAEAYERAGGQIRCEQRVENNALRRQGEFVRDRDSQKAAEFHRWRQDRVARQHDRRALEDAALEARQERDRELLRKDRDRRIEEKRRRVADVTRSDWRALYAKQQQDRRKLDAAQRSAWGRLRFFVRVHGPEYRAARAPGRREMLKGAFAALIGSKRQYAELERKQREERAAYGNKLKVRTKEITEGIRKEHERLLAELRERQNREREELRKRQSEQSQAEAREIRSGRDEEIYRKEQQAKLAKELAETKKQIVERPDTIKPRPPSLRARFNAAKGVEAKAPERPEIDKAAAPSIPAASKSPLSKDAEFGDQAREVTERKAPPERRIGGLAEKFQKARDAAPSEKEIEGKDKSFRDNGRDISRDQGRERSRSIRPPRPKKPR